MSSAATFRAPVDPAAAVKLCPVDDRLVVEPIAERTTPGGIVLTETAGEDDKLKFGTVFAVGGQVKDRNIKAQRLICYRPFGNNLVEVHGRKFEIIAANEVFAVLDEEMPTTDGD